MSQVLKTFTFLLSLLTLVLFGYGCQKETAPAQLSITKIESIQTNEYKYIDIPDGVYSPDNPEFDINKPNTWTGNMAQYVKINYFYTINYQVKNTGGSTAFDAEVDLYYFYDNGNETLKTFSLGDLNAGATIDRSVQLILTNKQLSECIGEVYWYDW